MSSYPDCPLSAKNGGWRTKRAVMELPTRPRLIALSYMPPICLNLLDAEIP
jgi:hypothetical protein